MSAINKLYKKKKSSDDLTNVGSLFAQKPVEVQKSKKQQKIVDYSKQLDKDIEEMDLENEGLNESDIEDENKQKKQRKSSTASNTSQDKIENPFATNELSLLQKKERDERTIFIGNVPLEVSKKDIIKLFKKYGKIENIRERSVPVRQSKDMSVKARVILKKTVEGKADDMVKNCYILFENKEFAEKSLEKNGFEYKGNSLRVDIAAQNELDFTKTIFIGNLGYNTTENMLRQHFAKCGAIVNVRLIRDKETHQGKGFGYVQFDNAEGYQASLLLKRSKLNDRELRIKKAVPKARLEKKKAKKEEIRKTNQEFAQNRIKNRLKDQLSETKSMDSKKPGSFNKQDKSKNFLKKGGEQAAKQFIKNQMENVDDVDMKNNIVVPPRMVRKAIKKSKKSGETAQEKFHKVQKVQKNFHKSNDRNIFNGEKGLKDRKTNREKRRVLNKKKVKDQIINE